MITIKNRRQIMPTSTAAIINAKIKEVNDYLGIVEKDLAKRQPNEALNVKNSMLMMLEDCIIELIELKRNAAPEDQKLIAPVIDKAKSLEANLKSRK